MINALLVVIRPETGWTRIARRENKFLVIALTEWSLLAFITVLFESWGMVAMGAGTNSIGNVYSLPLSKVINYQIIYLLLCISFIFIASVMIYFSINKEVVQCSFNYLLSVVIYLSCPVLFMKLFDAFPSINTWACFIATVMIVIISTYVAIPKTLFPNVTDGFSIFLIMAFLLGGMLFCVHFISVTTLKIG